MKEYKLIEAANSGYSEEFLEYVSNVLTNMEEFSTPYIKVFEQKFEIVNGTLMVKIGENEIFDMEILEV